MAKKVIVDEEVLRKNLTGEVPIFVPPAQPAAQEFATQELYKQAGQPIAVNVSSPLLVTQAGNVVDVLPPNVDNTMLLELENFAVESKAATEGSKTDKDLQRYEKMYLHRNLLGVQRTNVGISMETLTKIEQVVNRLFDGRIAASTFVDNVLYEHLARHEKLYNRWLAERSQTIF
jgi:hypothetical protein